jgi:hypothetical protein
VSAHIYYSTSSHIPYYKLYHKISVLSRIFHKVAGSSPKGRKKGAKKGHKFCPKYRKIIVKQGFLA